MKLTYSEQRYSRLRKILSKHVGKKNAEFLMQLTRRAEKDVKETVGKMLDPERPIILVGPGRSGDLAAHELMALLRNTHKFHRIPIVRIPASLRSVEPGARVDVGLALMNRQLLKEIKGAKANGAQIIYVDAVRNKGETQNAYENIAKRIGIEFDAIINLNEMPRHKIRVLGIQTDRYSKMHRLFHKKAVGIEINGKRYGVNIYVPTRKK